MAWNLSFKTGVWYFPVLNKHWLLTVYDRLEKLTGIKQTPLCFVHDRLKPLSATFYHDAGLRNLQESFHKLFLGRFFATYKKLFERLRRENIELCKQYAKGEVRVHEATELAILGGVLHLATQPHHMELIERDIQRLAKRRGITAKDFNLLLEHDEPTSEQRRQCQLYLLQQKLDRGRLEESDLDHYRITYAFEKAVTRTVSELPMMRTRQETLKAIREESSLPPKKLAKNLREQQAKQNALRQKYRLSKQESSLLRRYAELTYLRLECRNHWISHYVHVGEQRDAFYHQHGLKKDDLDMLSYEEFVQTIEQNRIIKAGLRPDLIVRLRTSKGVEEYYDSFAEEMLEHLDIPLVEDIPEVLQGQVTFQKGLIQGKARVVQWNIHFEKEMEKMRDGEILIVPQTKPDLLPAIRKAKGIVTDEGGLISHAAIISRELEIPCIIQTKHATKAFRTGDRIIMDTTTGEVRKK